MTFCKRTKNNCVHEPEKISGSIKSPETVGMTEILILTIRDRFQVWTDNLIRFKLLKKAVMKRNERASTMRKESYDQHSHVFDDGEYQLDLDTTNETFTERCRSNGRTRV